MSKNEVKQNRMELLIKTLNEASNAYYNGLEEIMSNYEWDAIFDELSNLENETGIIMPESPTQKTGDDETNGIKEEHEFPALSLAKTKKLSDLQKWSENRPIWLSWKLDGLTLVLTYDAGKLTKIVTRGNGIIGTNITFLKDAIKGFPQTIPYQGHLVVRGEATISYNDFNMLNAEIEDDDDKYANPRNLASGTLNLDDVEEVKKRHVTFNAFTMVHTDENIVSWGKRMEYLDKIGFTTVERTYISNPLTELATAMEAYTEAVESGKMDIPVDGLVICYDDTDYAATGSVTGHHATRAGYAFKWQDTAVESELDHIEWSCASSTISPVAVFTSVQIEGTTVSRASLCNVSEAKRLNIGDKGTKISVIKANKIIPKIINVVEKIGDLKVPCTCPACGAETEIHISEKSGTETLHCTNPKCPGKAIKKFTRFVDKDGMDIDGLSVQTIVTFINAGYLHNFADIYQLKNHLEEIKTMDGFGVKSAEKLEKAIEKSRDVSAVHFLKALCIPMIGTDVGKKIFGSMTFADFTAKLDAEVGFEDLEGIGPEKSNAILDWYAVSENKELFAKLLQEVTIKDMPQKKAGGSCEGVTFVITGDVNFFKNRDAFKEFVENQGGKVSGSVSKKTNYLVNNDVTSETGKNKKAKELGVPIISEEQFLDQFGK